MWPRRASSPRLRLSHLGKRNYSPLPSAAAAVSWPSPKRINQTPTCVWHAPGAVQTPGKEPLFPRTPAVLLSESHLPLCFGIHGAGVCRHALLQSVGLCTGNIVTYSFFLPAQWFIIQRGILYKIQLEPNQNPSSDMKSPSDHLLEDTQRHFGNYTFIKITQIKNA